MYLRHRDLRVHSPADVLADTLKVAAVKIFSSACMSLAHLQEQMVCHFALDKGDA